MVASSRATAGGELRRLHAKVSASRMRATYSIESIARLESIADERWRMLTYADVCWRMLTYADESIARLESIADERAPGASHTSSLRPHTLVA
jgi:hypothetical protein